MIIQSSQIALSSQHQFIQQESTQESLRVWHNAATREEAEHARAKLPPGADKVSLTQHSPLPRPQHLEDEHQHGLKVGHARRPVEADRVKDSEDIEEDMKNGWKLQLLRRLVEQLTGRKIKFVKASDFAPADDEAKPAPAADASEAPPVAAEEPLGWGLEYHYQHSYSESEQTSFSATGLVNTADGQQIELKLQLNMSRSFASSESIDLRAGDALKDPLVINYAGSAAQLVKTDLQFDIDLDGTPDQLKFVAPGSGFLALDKNNDGQINDGSELFGPTSGDGFAELAAYDQDGNNWIDENDDIYSRLRIWSRDSEGQMQLTALGQQGIGAIYLDRVATPFSLNNPGNEQLGQIQSSGIFLAESGLVGSVQQVDMVV